MGESTYEIEQEIGAARYQLNQNVQQLENKTRALTDWRTQYRRHPMAILGLTFGGALILGLAGRSRRPPVSTYIEAERERERERDYREPMRSFYSPTTERVRHHVSDTFERIADALLGVATAKAVEFVAQRVPGFRDHYSESVNVQ